VYTLGSSNSHLFPSIHPSEIFHPPIRHFVSFVHHPFIHPLGLAAFTTLGGFAGTKGLLARLHCGGLIVVKDCSVRRIPVGFLHVVVVFSPLVSELFERGFFKNLNTVCFFLLDRVL
jgi:hypothetical protein